MNSDCDVLGAHIFPLAPAEILEWEKLLRLEIVGDGLSVDDE